MSARTRLIALCTGLAVAFVMTTAAVAAAKVEPGQKSSSDKEADPDPHRLAMFAARGTHGLTMIPVPRAPKIVLYDQTDNQGINAFNSQDFESFYDQYDDQAADDFVVTGAGWTVTTVVTPGVYFNGTGPAPSLHVTFYEDDGGGLPGAPLCDYPVVTTFTGAASGSFVATLTPACNLTPGTKWVSVVANMDFAAGGQWGWGMRTVISGNPAAWQNPGGGFGFCPTWAPRAFFCATDTAAEPDQVFRLDGSFSSCVTDADCQDGDLCNGVETCVASACQPGTPVNCSDGLFCTLDTCDSPTGTCGHTPNLCSDGDSCTIDFCDEANHACTHVSPPTIHRCNTGPITIPDSGNASPYPSTISVSGLSSVGGLCSVELNGISHTFPSDIDMLVVAPGTPQNAIVMSDVGGGSGVSGVNLMLKDGAALSIPTPLVSGTFKPTNAGAGDPFPGAPAPTGGSALSAFDGTNPNGDWKLYIVDDAGGDVGTVAGGWCVNLVLSGCSTNAECNDGDPCNGVETCAAGTCTPGTSIDCNDGLFCTIDSCDPLTGTCGHALTPCSDGDACTLDSCDEAGDACVHTSAAVRFCNTGAISIPDSGTATPYPSTISVAGLGTSAAVCSVELKGIAHTFPSDIDMLLVGPGTPQNAIFMSDAGGGTAVTFIDLTLTDAAALSIPTPLISGTFKPTNLGAGDSFPGAPAPTGGSALSVFDGTNPNGDWNLYVVDDAAGDVGTLAGGWCVNLVVEVCTSNADCDDGNACNGVETCVATNCMSGTPVDCNDGLFCTTDTCAPSTGTCGHTPNTCDDGDSCTVDSCNEAGDTCVHDSASCFTYDQTDFPNAFGFNSQNFEASYDAYDNQAADDFVVTGAGWVVGTVMTPGAYFNGAGPAQSLHVTFYADAGGLPGAVASGCDYPAVTTFTGGATGSFTTTLTPPCSLSPGPKWVSVQVNMDFGAGGQWGWTMRDVQSFNPSVWRNPGGGFPGGCFTYTPRGICEPTTAASPDQSFRLDGSLGGCDVDADCQDGNLCNGIETCVAGACASGTPVDCGDGLFCTTDTCDPSTGICGHALAPCSDGDSCTLDSCDEAGDVCVHTNAAVHFCNTGAISIPDSGTATPYPSTINVAGLSTTASVCSVELLGITHTFPSDIDMLVVAPGTPQNAIVMSDVGGGSAVSDVNLTLADAAALSIPTPLVSGIFRPTNLGTGDSFPGAPAPTGGSALSVFDGTNPNGDWNLYVVDDAGGDVGTLAGGWCVSLVVEACTSNADCDDGNACNGVETCVATNCTSGKPVDCNDGLFCTTDTCAPSTGSCGHTPNACDDGNSCSIDSCDEAGDTCVHDSGNCFSYDQTDFPNAFGFNSQNFEASYDAYDDQAADDFVVTGAGWVVSTVTTPGAYFNGPGPAPSLHVSFYDNAGTLPGAVVAGCDYPAVTTFTGGATGSFITTLTPPCTLTPGPKWVSVQVNMDFGAGGQWGWTMRDVQSFNPSVWRNPGGGFPGGCLTYTPRGICEPTTAASPDQSFRLDGSFAGCDVDADCQDGNLCNGVETCVAGACAAGTPVDCSDGLFCTLDTCDPPTGTCGHAPNPCADTDGCTNDTCDEGADACVHFNVCTQVCNSGSITINDTAAPPTIASPYPSIINVSGGSGLFTLVSVELRGITHTFPDDLDILLAAPNVANGAIIMSDVGGAAPATGVNLVLTDGAPVIPDGGPLVSGTFGPNNVNPGTGTEAWPAPAPVPSGSSALSQFNGSNPNGDWKLYVVDDQGVDFGSMAGGWCLNYKASCSTPADCNDGNACTTDVCEANGSCSHNTIACNDGNACNGVETCNPASGCVAGTPPVCNDGNACNGLESCNPATGCIAGTPLSCNDGNACNGVETCNPASGCVSGTPLSCNDGNACNGVETCNPASGCVSGTPLSCNDGNACNGVETCNPASGCVSGTPLSCNDGNACNGVETCNPASGCVGGTPVVCAPAGQCQTAGVCAPATGICSYGNQPNGTTCDDGNSSTSADSCQNGVCVGGASCTPNNRPKTKGYYRHLCRHSSHHGDSITDADAACVGHLTATFAGITTRAQVCDVLDGDRLHEDDWSRNSCSKAEDQLMALALNICRQRVCPDQGIDSRCDDNGNEGDLMFGHNHAGHHDGDDDDGNPPGESSTVAISLATADGILSDPSRTSSECRVAECLAKEINNGHALEFDSLIARREGSNLLLSWIAPVLDDGSAAPSSYRIWRRDAASTATFVQIGTTVGLSYLDVTGGTTTSWEYDVTAVLPDSDGGDDY